ncbi:MAG: DUF4230 domain-containing protein [Candidatus Riflebacteria bacterium]|nr:DUF4230 domain-containing protein [Candidatus Riflebacteria bacterium]
MSEEIKSATGGPGCVVTFIKASAVVISVALLGAFLLLNRLAEVPREIFSEPFRHIANLIKPEVSVSTVMNAAVNSLKKTPKLVVLTAAFGVETKKISTKSVFWGYVSLGDTIVTLRAIDNKVQYYIPLDKISRESLIYDEINGRLSIKIPQPRLDENLIEVQTDPAKIEIMTSLGWARFDKFSGKKLRDESARELRNAVIEQGRDEYFLVKARKEAEKMIKRSLSEISEAMKKDLPIDVTFSQED